MKRFFLTAGALSLLLVALVLAPRPAASAGASSKPATMRPTLPGKFVWFDLLTNDAAAAETYYGGLFGWTFEVLKGHEPPYKIIRQGGAPIGGVVDMTSRKEHLPESMWLSYVSVPDVDAAAAAFKEKGGNVQVADAGAATEKAKALGGRVVLAPRADIRDGSLAIVVDPTGAALALQEFPFEKAGR